MSSSSTFKCHSSSSSSSSTSTSIFYTGTWNGRYSWAREWILFSAITWLLLSRILVGSQLSELDIGSDSTTSSSVLYPDNWYGAVVLIILQISLEITQISYKKKSPKPTDAVLIRALILMLNWLGSSSKLVWICLLKSQRLIISSAKNVHATRIS
jgi:hypothetical protein